MEVSLTLGLLLAAGVAANGLASVFRLPKISFYIIIGLLIGPSLLGWVPEEHLELLDPVLKLALALVMLAMGSRFTLIGFGNVMRRVWPLSVGELCLTFLLVGAGLWLLGERLDAALLLGGLALATAPATTVLVLREYNSEGPVTNSAYAMVVLNNLASIVLFELLFILVLLLEEGVGAAPGGRLFWLAADLGGSTLLGGLGGLVVSYTASQLSGKPRDVALFALVITVLGVCESLEMPYLLTFLVMGIVMASSSQLAREIIDRLEQVGTLLYVVFFVAAGAKLKLAKLPAAGVGGIGYIAFRCLGKYFGVYAAARVRQESRAVRRWLGCTLLAQAGAAIGLVQVAAHRAQDLGENIRQLGAHLSTIIIGTVVFFELVGPILTGTAVVRAGEVPLAHVIEPHRPRWWAGLRVLVNRLRMSLGQEPWHGRSPQSLTVADLMRRNMAALTYTDDFVRILDFIEHSRHHTFPVVNSEGHLLGVIRYGDIRTALFDPGVSRLVLAEDLTVPCRSMTPDQPLDEALALFETGSDDVLPVVASQESTELVGVIERHDVVRVIKRLRTESESMSS